MRLRYPRLFLSSDPGFETRDQELIDVARKDCRSSRARVTDLALFSPNETLDDIATQDLVYLFVPYVLAEIESRARATERGERLARLREAEVCVTPTLSPTYLVLEKTYSHALGSKDSASSYQT